MDSWKERIERCITGFMEQAVPYEEYLREKFKNYSYICIFGVGNLGIPTLKSFQRYHLRVDFLCDNDSQKWGKCYEGVRCISLQELESIKEKTLVIICARAYREIYAQLMNMNFEYLERIFVNKIAIHQYFLTHSAKEILNEMGRVLDVLEDEESKRIYTRLIEEWMKPEYEHGGLDDIYTGDQYFCKEFICLQDDEVFIDGGAYTGDTLEQYLQKSGGKFEKMYLFELSSQNYQYLLGYIRQLDEEVQKKIVPINKGLSDKIQETFYAECDEGSTVEEMGNQRGYLTTIDQECRERISYIKMDIEGSEWKALQGARASILKYRPRLAVCLYHKPADMWELPLLVKEIMPDYRIFIRHHTDLLNETTLYAV